mgnify:CR=1 FL=1
MRVCRASPSMGCPVYFALIASTGFSFAADIAGEIPLTTPITDDITNPVILGLHPGAIILCHNNGAHTADAIAEIIPYAIEHGYTFVPIGELIYKGAYSTDHQGMQKIKE